MRKINLIIIHCSATKRADRGFVRRTLDTAAGLQGLFIVGGYHSISGSRDRWS